MKRRQWSLPTRLSLAGMLLAACLDTWEASVQYAVRHAYFNFSITGNRRDPQVCPTPPCPKKSPPLKLLRNIKDRTAHLLDGRRSHWREGSAPLGWMLPYFGLALASLSDAAVFERDFGPPDEASLSSEVSSGLWFLAIDPRLVPTHSLWHSEALGPRSESIDLPKDRFLTFFWFRSITHRLPIIFLASSKRPRYFGSSSTFV